MWWHVSRVMPFVGMSNISAESMQLGRLYCNNGSIYIYIYIYIYSLYLYHIYIYIYVCMYVYIYILYILSDTKDWCFTSGLCRWLQEADASGISLNANLVCCVRAFVCGQHGHGHDIGSKWLKLYDTLRSWRSMHQKMYPCIQNTYWTIHDYIILCVILYLIILKCLLSSLSYCILLSDILPHGLVHHTSEAIDVCLRNRKAEEGFRWLERIQDQPLGNQGRLGSGRDQKMLGAAAKAMPKRQRLNWMCIFVLTHADPK